MTAHPHRSTDTGDRTAEATLETSLTCENLAMMRERLRQVLRGFDGDFVDDVQLVCTELAANACDHADNPRHLSVRRYDGELLVEVRDATSDRDPVVGTSSLGPYRGNGMRMVEALSSDWGVRHLDDRAKVVWARLPLPVR